MKQIISCLLLLLLITSCSKQEKDQNRFDNVYDELLLKCNSLSELSQMAGIDMKQLVEMRYGIINENQEVTERLIEILKAYNSDNERKLAKILNNGKKIDLDEQKSTANIAPSDFLKVQKFRISEFDNLRSNIISDFITVKVDSLINDKYSLLSFIPNTWKYYTKSNDDFAEELFSEFNASKIAQECEKYYISRINNLKNSVGEEFKTLNAVEIDVPDFFVISVDNEVSLDEAIKTGIIERTKSQIKEISSDIFWDLIITFIISLIISWLMNLSINSARDNAIDKFMERMRWNSEKGFFKNLVGNVLTGFGIYGEYEEEVENIKSSYRNKKIILNILVFVLGFIVCYIWVIKPQIKIEMELADNLTESIIESSPTLSINPWNRICPD